MRISILAVVPRDKKTVTQAEGDSESDGKVATAQENGWQRCFSCWRMVELDHGCNYMTFVAFCRCGAECCYNCRMEWKNCQCEFHNGTSIVSLHVHIESLIEKQASRQLRYTKLPPPPNKMPTRPFWRVSSYRRLMSLAFKLRRRKLKTQLWQMRNPLQLWKLLLSPLIGQHDNARV
ncbi:hypothetical protein ASPFODRAFT_713883 [Aspergillus luchuensis CBS 106.47]|uniref:IBR domain-containing protein n=1 Tax=Aspergillus luchuensis (strain CBS 106.47) TaxID=1137211 RepID=A0A1M3SYW3_ASPLC|nr:hypothetical protein ASPFODRAFT_713883 [Aspergillus luchuensis CBS 106.47]